MKRNDHLYLGRFLADRYLNDKSKIIRKSFLWGNILPDINLFSYFRGFTKTGNIEAHSYEGSASYMQFLTEYLNRPCHSKILYYVRLGILIHYIADTFTYPHNSCFTGTLKEHILYENKFHRIFRRVLKNVPPKENHGVTGSSSYSNLTDTIKRLQGTYLPHVGNVLWDARNIIRASMIVMDCHSLP